MQVKTSYLFILACKFIKILFMPYLNFNTTRPFTKMSVTFLSIVSIGIIVYFIGILFTKFVFSLHLDDVNHAIFGRYENLTDWQLKVIQTFQTLGFFVLPGVFLYWLFSSPTSSYFNISFKIKPGIILLTIFTMFVSLPFINWVININDLVSFPDFMNGFEETVKGSGAVYDDLTKRLVHADNIFQLLISFFIIGILPAIGEEFIFRGIFQKIFSEISKNVHLPVLLTAFIFSVVHGQFHGFIARFLLGAFLGYLMVWGKTIWLPVLGHFVFNSLNILIYYFLLQHGHKISFGIEGTGLSMVILPGSIVLTTVSIFLLRRILMKENAQA